jgi:hypothetical protein
VRGGNGLLRQWDVLRAALSQADLAAQDQDALCAELSATQTARQEINPAPVRDDAPAEPPDSTRSAGRRWWRRMTGGAVDLS